MKAVLVRQVGGPEVLEVADQPSPEPGSGQLRVDVEAAGVNFIDTYERSGQYRRRTPFVAGSEGAGTVSGVGPEVDGVTVGDRVAWAMVRGAGYAGQVLVPADRAVPVPDGVDTETAAAALLQGMTAHYLTRSTYHVSADDNVLIHAAAGGTGLLLTQLCRIAGARVIATTSTQQKADLAREAGATDVIVYGSSGAPDLDIASEVRRLTDGTGVAVVYDGVGRSTFDASLDSLRPRGLMVLFGASSGRVPPFDPQVLNAKGSLFLTRPSLAHYVAGRDELLQRASEIFEWVRTGQLTVRIGGRYPLTEARRAHEDLAARRTTGKLLVIP